MLKRWEDLPDYMRVPEVRPYYDILQKRQLSLLVKRVFDFVAALILLIVLAIPMAVIAVLIKFSTGRNESARMANILEFTSSARW